MLFARLDAVACRCKQQSLSILWFFDPQAALYASAELQPVAAVLGGIVAQEVVKMSGKYTPLDQWLHMDFYEILPSVIPDDTYASEDE